MQINHNNPVTFRDVFPIIKFKFSPINFCFVLVFFRQTRFYGSFKFVMVTGISYLFTFIDEIDSFSMLLQSVAVTNFTK